MNAAKSTNTKIKVRLESCSPAILQSSFGWEPTITIHEKIEKNPEKASHTDIHTTGSGWFLVKNQTINPINNEV